MSDVSGSTGPTESVPASVGGKRNKWLTHVKKTMKSHKGKSFKAILKAAKKSYKGGEETEGDETPVESSEGGRRRRKSRKTRRSRKH